MTQASKTSVLVADPLPLFSDALSLALAAGHPDLTVFDERPANGPSTVAAAAKLRPDFALVDYWMPDMEGPAITRAILSQVPQCNVMLLSWLSSPSHIDQGLKAGAVGFIPKDASVAQVADSIRRVYSGEPPAFAAGLSELVNERAASNATETKRFQMLTPRQIEILALLNSGRSTVEIANRLGIRAKTVSNHISDILAKTGTLSQTEVLAKARQSGFLRS